MGQAAPAGGGLSPLGENSRAQKRRPTPIEICPLKAVCRVSGTKSNLPMLWMVSSIALLLLARCYADGTQAAGNIPFLSSTWQFYAAALADNF